MSERKTYSDESVHNLIKLLDKRQARIKALESLVRDMYGEWCATIDDYYDQRIDKYYERITEPDGFCAWGERK